MTTPNATLAALIARYCGDHEGALATPVPRLHLIRRSEPTEGIFSLHETSLYMIVQGAKRVMLGEHIYTYDPSRVFIVTVDLPMSGQVLHATRETPYLGLRLGVDLATLADLVISMDEPASPGAVDGPGAMVSPLTGALLDAVLRLASLVDAPRDIPVLAPLAEREILYRLLTGCMGRRVAQLGHGTGRLAQVRRAIAWIRCNYDRPLRIAQLADEAGMSPSALHQHFRTVTAMSPLQYQKSLRLQEARRLILSQSLDAAAAGHRVGYDSASQFSREYSRLFGRPPLRDVSALRSTPGVLAEI